MTTSVHEPSLLGRNVARLMAARNINQDELAKLSSVSQSTISRLLAGLQKSLRTESLTQLAIALNVSIDALTKYELPEALQPKTTERFRDAIAAYAVDAYSEGDLPSTHAPVQHIDFQISAGSGSEVPVFAETKYPMLYRIEWFHRLNVRPEHVRSMGVRGSSMERTLFDGDRIAINTIDVTPANDRVYALILDGEAVVKRLFRQAGGLRIVSDNDDKLRYPDTLVSADELSERVQIIGRVIDKSGAGGL